MGIVEALVQNLANTPLPATFSHLAADLMTVRVLVDVVPVAYGHGRYHLKKSFMFKVAKWILGSLGYLFLKLAETVVAVTPVHFYRVRTLLMLERLDVSRETVVVELVRERASR
ncbi:hypothetical protein L873DRAFT_1793066 [Choiromyces venosus 120613-1]|uniref:Uncharacterized protein n=1 Tax=Choiromyces venosus 120613-1 TaxID=1336337 RepID=A0A3N4J7X3_9PEZI|nr:hypothetical protein L873DRAFT_1793066 [Choiromyces venosus 120613-1]